MTDDDAVRIVHDYISRQFPKDCKVCGRRYHSIAEFIRTTTYVGQPRSYDAEREDWTPEEPLGTFSLSNCSCGATLAVSSDQMDVNVLWKLMEWGKGEMERRGITMSDLLDELRKKIDKRILEETEGKPNDR